MRDRNCSRPEAVLWGIRRSGVLDGDVVSTENCGVVGRKAVDDGSHVASLEDCKSGWRAPTRLRQGPSAQPKGATLVAVYTFLVKRYHIEKPTWFCFSLCYEWKLDIHNACIYYKPSSTFSREQFSVTEILSFSQFVAMHCLRSGGLYMFA